MVTRTWTLCFPEKNCYYFLFKRHIFYFRTRLLDTLPTLLPQPSLLKRCLPKLSSSVPKTKSERDLYIPCAVRNEHYLRHTRLYWNNNYRKVGVSWWLFLLVFLRTTSNVSLALQY